MATTQRAGVGPASLQDTARRHLWLHFTRMGAYSADAEIPIGFPGELYRRGLICRADDRGDPVIQLAPPLITTAEQFGEIHDILRPVLAEASARLGLA